VHWKSSQDLKRNNMQIIWNQEAADRLKNSHTVLELETIEVAGYGPVTAYCVVPPEKLFADGFSNLERYVTLHNGFIAAYKEQNTTLCNDIAEHLKGAFGGELDSFYEEILKRIR
jgi:hypothetical protein